MSKVFDLIDHIKILDGKYSDINHVEKLDSFRSVFELE